MELGIGITQSRRAVLKLRPRVAGVAPMDNIRGWGFSRYAALFVVLAFHLALFAALLLTIRSMGIPPAAMHAVEVVFLPTVTPPKVRSEIAAPWRFTGALSAAQGAVRRNHACDRAVPVI